MMLKTKMASKTSCGDPSFFCFFCSTSTGSYLFAASLQNLYTTRLGRRICTAGPSFWFLSMFIGGTCCRLSFELDKLPFLFVSCMSVYFSYSQSLDATSCPLYIRLTSVSHFR